MSNPVIIWLAGILGWDTGPVVALVTVLVIFVGAFVLHFIMVGLPTMLVNRSKRASRPGKVILGCLLFIVIIVGLIIHTVLAIIIVLGLISLAGDFKEWWKK